MLKNLVNTRSGWKTSVSVPHVTQPLHFWLSFPFALNHCGAMSDVIVPDTECIAWRQRSCELRPCWCLSQHWTCLSLEACSRRCLTRNSLLPPPVRCRSALDLAHCTDANPLADASPQIQCFGKSFVAKRVE